MKSGNVAEVLSGRRFAFGENWLRFLRVLDEGHIRLAEQSICEMLRLDNLRGRRFLDVGSGSGLFSLAARRLGAQVRSFDYDPQSVACTNELKQRFFPGDPLWMVERGSVLDADFVRSLGQWDLVYSWGVLHHTGAMWQAFEFVASLVVPGGRLYIAIYNDQGAASGRWLRTKQAYNRLPSALRWLVVGPAIVRLWGPSTVRDLLRGRPLETWNSYARRGRRGMSPWRDVMDWVGGLPFEVAKPEQVFSFYQARGFIMRELRTCAGGIGCNEFVFEAPRHEPAEMRKE